MVAASYSPREINVWESSVASAVVRLVEQMDAMCTEPLSDTASAPKRDDPIFDVVHWSYLFAFESVINIGLGKDLHFIEAEIDEFSLLGANGAIKKTNFLRSPRAASTLVWEAE